MTLASSVIDVIGGSGDIAEALIGQTPADASLVPGFTVQVYRDHSSTVQH